MIVYCPCCTAWSEAEAIEAISPGPLNAEPWTCPECGERFRIVFQYEGPLP